MPSVQRRKTPKGNISFRAMVRVKGHKTKTATFLKRADASLWAHETELRLRQSKYFPNKLIELEKYTLGDLLNRYQSEVLPKKKSNGQIGQLKWWKNQLGGRKLKNIYPALISTYKEKLIQEPSERTKRKRASATVNRYLALLSHAFTVAVREWQWMEINPAIQISKPKEAQGRTRFLSDEERQRLLNVCSSSKNTHLFTLVTLALSTGMRRGEMLGLRWENIDIQNRRITLVITKNGERRGVPLVGKAYELIKELFLKLEPENKDLLFPSPNNSKKSISIRTAWETVLKKSRIENFRFHDLRHTTASYLAMNGASLLEIADILGHKTLQMVKRYSHLSEDHKATVLEKMNMKVFG